MNLKYSKNFILSEEDIIKYILNRCEKLKIEPSKNKLILFHTHNKFLLMAHDQDRLQFLGNIVANHKKMPLSECIKDYEIHLKEALSIPPTTKRHINTLMHIFGHFSKDFDQSQKESFLDLLEQFREGKITLGATLWEIEPLVYLHNKTYLASQTYFLVYAEKRTLQFFKN